MKMAEYSSRQLEQTENVIFEPVIRGLKSDIFDWDQVQNPFHLCKSRLQKKKSGVKKCLDIFAINA